VRSIEPPGRIELRNNTTGWVIQSNVEESTTVWKQGLTGNGEIIGLIDTLPDITSCFFRDPSLPLPDRQHRKLVNYRSAGAPFFGSHGTHVLGTAVGAMISGDLDGSGIAYGARATVSNVSDLDAIGSSNRSLTDYLIAAHADGARIHSNSWGDESTAAYTSWCVDVDAFARSFEEDLVIFAATNRPAIRSPENAKNVLAVASSYQAPQQAQVVGSGRGPTPDGRLKPDLIAPGYRIQSAALALPASCELEAMSGNSMAAPAIAGAAALARQYFREGFYPLGKRGNRPLLPSGALLKALLINSGNDMDSAPGYPNSTEGWGRLVLDDALAFANDRRRLWIADVRHQDGLLMNEETVYEIEVASEDEPLKITLAYMDLPGSPLAIDPVVHDLDLLVSGPAGAFFGNRMHDGVSVPGGQPDEKNNVEAVIIPQPPSGRYTITVKASWVSSERQGYGLVATGDIAVPPPELTIGAAEQTTDTFGLTVSLRMPAGLLHLADFSIKANGIDHTDFALRRGIISRAGDTEISLFLNDLPQPTKRMEISASIRDLAGQETCAAVVLGHRRERKGMPWKKP